VAPRFLTREAKFVKHIPWLQHVFANSPLEHDIVTSLNVDGGLINNEPFEKVRYLLNVSVAGERNMPFGTPKEKESSCAALEGFNTSYDTFENTVLMVDPFPNVQSTGFKAERDLFTVLPNTLSAMLSQMRSKPGE